MNHYLFLCLARVVQVQSVTQISQKLDKVKLVIECMRSEEADRDASSLHSSVQAAAQVGLVVPLEVLKFELMMVGKENTSSQSFDQWAELLMMEAVPTATLRRRLCCLKADRPLQLQAQEQLVFDALVTLTKNVDQHQQFAQLMQSALQHKAELPQQLLDEVEFLHQVVPDTPECPPFASWTEAKLALYKQKVRGTGKLVRQFGLQPLGASVLANIDSAFANLKKNKASHDQLLRLRVDLTSESFVAWKASKSDTDFANMKGRVMKVKKELDAVRASMDAQTCSQHEATFVELDGMLTDNVNFLFKHVDDVFDNSVGAAISEFWKLGSKSPREALSKESRGKLMKTHIGCKETLQQALQVHKQWTLETLASEQSSLALKAKKRQQLVDLLQWGVPLLSGDVLADEAPAIEDICGLKDVLDSFSSCDKLVELVFSEKCATKTSLTYLWEKKVLPLLKEATTGLSLQAWTGMCQKKEVKFMKSVYKTIVGLGGKSFETPQQIIAKLKKTDETAIKALDMTSFEELAQQLEHLTSIGIHGRDDVDPWLALALPMLLLTRGVVQIVEMFDSDVSNFVGDPDHKLTNLFPVMQERFVEMIAKCRSQHQIALRVLADTEVSDTDQLPKKLEVLGSAPKKLQEKAKMAGNEVLSALASLTEHYNTIQATGLNSIKNVRVMYRSEDGLALFKKVKDLCKAWPNTSVCCICVWCVP